MAAAAAVLVVMKAVAAVALAPRAEPALKPNQPNQRMPVPISVHGRAWGGMASLGQPFRLPITRMRTSAAIPALMWTTVPPAKSRAPRLNSQPWGLKTQWATGEYTRTLHAPRKATHPPNLRRSAVAPVMRAGVMMANIIWKRSEERRVGKECRG